MTINVSDTTAASAVDNTSEYTLGSTTYTVTLNFNNDGETLTELLGRLIDKRISCQPDSAA